MHSHLLAGTAMAVGIALAGCLKEEDEEEPAPESSGTNVMAYENGHPLLTETTHARQLAVEEELLRLTNDHRASIGLPPLQPHPVAGQEARAVARHMRVHHFVGHDNPEGEGPGDRHRRVGMDPLAYGENIAWGWESAAEAFRFWLDSPPHRANLDNPSWTHVGMGFWSGGDSFGTYHAQEFLTLR